MITQNFNYSVLKISLSFILYSVGIPEDIFRTMSHIYVTRFFGNS